MAFIYVLCLAPNLQGGYQIMDLWTGNFITRPKLFQITIKDFLVNPDEKMDEDQVFKSLKIYN